MKMGWKSKHWTGKLNEKQIGFFARPCDPNVLLLLSIQLGKSAFSNLTNYKSVKAMLLVHISLERKEWISCNVVSCIT